MLPQHMLDIAVKVHVKVQPQSLLGILRRVAFYQSQMLRVVGPNDHYRNIVVDLSVHGHQHGGGNPIHVRAND